jgi:hypothetical protein
VAELVREGPALVELSCGTTRKAAVENNDAVIDGIVAVHNGKCRISQEAFPFSGEAMAYERRNDMGNEDFKGLLDGVDVEV